MARLFKNGSFVEHDEILNLTTREVLVRTEPEQLVNVDGEIITSTPERFSVDANALDVIVPSTATSARRDLPSRAEATDGARGPATD